MAKVSVIIPCYNAESFINKCLDSVVLQTIGIDKLEVICVNDASTDNTYDILCQYEQKYPESFLIINNDQNARQGYARNLALQYSTSDYITYIDSDDYIDERMIEVLFSHLDSSDYDYVSCGFYRVVDNENYIVNESFDKPREYVIDTDEKREAFIIDDNDNLGCWGTLYRKTFLTLNNISFAEGIVYEDLLFMGLKRLYVNKCLVMPDRMYFYVDHNKTSIITSRNSSHHFDRLKAMERYLSECKSRGLYKKYKNAIQNHFLSIYYINSLILFANRFDNVPADVLNHMIATIKREVPDYGLNPYIMAYEGIAATLFSIIAANPTTQNAWDEIINILKDL